VHGRFWPMESSLDALVERTPLSMSQGVLARLRVRVAGSLWIQRRSAFATILIARTMPPHGGDFDSCYSLYIKKLCADVRGPTPPGLTVSGRKAVFR
jgi:hypothetical protein